MMRASTPIRTKLLIILSVLACAGTSAASTLDLGFNYSKSSSEERGVNISFSAEKNDFSTGADFRYSKQDREVSANNAGLRFGYDSPLSGKWSLWLFNQSRYDRIQKINFENLFGGGPKYSLAESGATSLSLSAGILGHHISYEGGKADNLLRFSARPKFSWKISEAATFKFISFYQPDIADFSDYIITATAELSHAVSKKISLKMKANEIYRSVTESKHNDIALSLLLSFNF